MTLKSAQAVTVRILPWLLVDPRTFYSFRHFPFPFDGRENSRLQPFYWEKWWAPEDYTVLPKWNQMQSTMSEVDRRFKRYRTQGLRYKYPFQLTLHVDQSRISESEFEIIQSMTRDERMLVTAEWRPPMRLQFAAGDQVLSGKSRGTVGGVISDGNALYGVTCSHVVGGSSGVTDLAGNSIGTVGKTKSPSAMTAGTVCTPFPAPGASGAHINADDFALIDLSVSIHPSGYSAQPAATLQQCDLVDVKTHGKSMRCTVRSLCIAMGISHLGNTYCFAPLVELYSASGTTQPGDSGSWGIKSGTDWATMIVGADSISSFAFDARDVSQWIDGCGAVSSGNWSIQ